MSAKESGDRGAIRSAWENDVCDAVCDAENGKVVGDFATLWKASRVAALLSGEETIPAGEVRPEVLAFAHLMERQLRANDHKPGWKGDSPQALWRRVNDEAHELGNVVVNRGDINPVEAGREAADVANFAMMVADVCGALAYTPKTPDLCPEPELCPSSHDHDLSGWATTTEGGEAEGRLRCIVSHATGGALSSCEGLSINAISVEISRHHNRIWEHAQEAALKPSDGLREALETEQDEIRAAQLQCAHAWVQRPIDAPTHWVCAKCGVNWSGIDDPAKVAS